MPVVQDIPMDFSMSSHGGYSKMIFTTGALLLVLGKVVLKDVVNCTTIKPFLGKPAARRPRALGRLSTVYTWAINRTDWGSQIQLHFLPFSSPFPDVCCFAVICASS